MNPSMTFECDVLVCGAGPAGFSAAISSAREGAKTVIIDRESGPGGAVAWALVTPLMTFHATPEKQIIGGIAEELVKDTVKAGGSPGHIPDPLGVAATITPVMPEIFADCVARKLDAAGVKTIYNTAALSADSTERRVSSVRTRDAVIKASAVIDATGDAAIAHMAGAESSTGRACDGKTQPMTLIFIMDGVDGGKVREYIAANPAEFVLSEQARREIMTLPLIAVSGFFSLVKKAQAEKKLVLFRDRVLYFDMPRRGQVAVNMTRITGLCGLNPADLKQAGKTGRTQAAECVKFLTEYVPGFEHAHLSSVAPSVGIRETRHIKGRATLTETDVLEGRLHADGIAMGAFPIDIHSPDGAKLDLREMKAGTFYNIPYGCMIPAGIDNLLVAGRAISATHEANASARLSPTCMALGEAAGTAAAMAVKEGILPSDIDVKRLRAKLAANGAII